MKILCFTSLNFVYWFLKSVFIVKHLLFVVCKDVVFIQMQFCENNTLKCFYRFTKLSVSYLYFIITFIIKNLTKD